MKLLITPFILILLLNFQVVEDGYEFFAKRQLVTLFSAPNYCGEFDNAGAMMSVDETLMCSFQVRRYYMYKRVVYLQCSIIISVFSTVNTLLLSTYYLAYFDYFNGKTHKK